MNNITIGNIEITEAEFGRIQEIVEASANIQLHGKSLYSIDKNDVKQEMFLIICERLNKGLYNPLKSSVTTYVDESIKYTLVEMIRREIGRDGNKNVEKVSVRNIEPKYMLKENIKKLQSVICNIIKDDNAKKETSLTSIKQLKGFSTLSTNEKKASVLFFDEYISQKNIAAKMNTTEATVAQYIRRAKNKIRRFYE